jgi:N utilization substance protein B
MRRRGRELALKIIYSYQDTNSSVEAVLEDFWSNFRFRDDILGDAVDDTSEVVPAEVRRFTEDLALGALANLSNLDSVIKEYSTNWTLERMAKVDLSLLRLATFELLFHPDVPTSVVINEAIEIGKRYGTKDTPAFINGILDKISRTRRQQDQ